ncbi:2-hydroxy-3-oxopropionate reductase [Sphaerochaeta sp. S2]|uniref:2-hydroxy-3-oxopropionate reductase n=1 Tax=Sphaerochaeta sp. S2 TaxID=2798868 RepID=UPI0018E969CC|nr:2-hydroxy-3-oxopropionate reductase [Sphaerochaeta sp. S2]MBJ2355953.1 2-hydroxy-3-oxopropionate reductase [Sphaerochaeta sp. S2]MDY0244216.1 2-hydroxy-3-oxopropionate reductase [Sphaerochaeta sp.]
MKIGFIGLGIMGKPMAKNLIKAGYSLVVNDINKEAVAELVSAGAAEAASAKEVASQSDVVVTMLPNSPHVQTVVLGEGGVIEGAREGLVVVDMSSISPIVSREVAAELAKKGVVMLDAPVSGGEPKAIDGTLAIMVGGPEETFKQVEPILQVMGGSVTLVGEIGSGNTTKLANQIMVAANIAGMSEALVLATKADVDPEKVFKAIRGGLAGSTVLDAKAPLVLDGNFKPGFRIDLHIKDLQNALDTAATVKTPTPLSDSIIEMMRSLSSDGKGSDDHGGLVQWYEKEAGIEVRK